MRVFLIIDANLTFFIVRDVECIMSLLAIPCCQQKFLRKLSIEDIHTSELHFKNMDQTGQRNYVLGYLTNRSQL